MALIEPLLPLPDFVCTIDLNNCCWACINFVCYQRESISSISIHLHSIFFVYNRTRAKQLNITNGLNWAPFWFFSDWRLNEAQDDNEEEEKNPIKCKQGEEKKMAIRHCVWIAKIDFVIWDARVCEYAMTPCSNSNASIFNRIQVANSYLVIQTRYEIQRRPFRIKYSTLNNLNVHNFERHKSTPIKQESRYKMKWQAATGPR